MGRWIVRIAAIGVIGLAACSSEQDPNNIGPGASEGNATSNAAPSSDAGRAPPTQAADAAAGQSAPPDPVNVDTRVVSYTDAMRTASLKLVGDLPTLVDIKSLDGKSTADQKAIYGAFVDRSLADPRFADRMIQWWRDTLKTGPTDDAEPGGPSFDTAATFAAMVVTADRPYTDLFTATKDTCPTYDSGVFTPASCQNGAPTAGLLTDPGLMAQYMSNMAMRRARFVQETFACSKFPAELISTGKPMGAGLYTSPWDFDSITGKKNSPNARIDFQDTSAVICANCHSTINHFAPLFSYFDEQGNYTAGAVQVNTPSEGNPTSVLDDWLPAGKQSFAWRNGTPVTDIPSLGKAIAADPQVAHCAVDRVWNWALSRGDIVGDAAAIPPIVTDALVQDFAANGYKLKRVIRNVFTSDEFVKF